MLPVLTIIGRPNVGKSTLFNYLTQTRAALVSDMPGVTRDRQYGEGVYEGKPFIVVDTGGIAEPDDPTMAALTDKQVDQAIEEADVLLFMVDAHDGLTAADQQIAERLRRHHVNKVILLVNKADRQHAGVVVGDFYSLGLGEPVAIAAQTGRGVADLLENTLKDIASNEEPVEQDEMDSSRINIAVVGRPNVGKSTLINRIMGEDRLVVLDRPGTTRDSIYIPFDYRDQHYTLIDTAGIRRRSKVSEAIEKFSIVKAMQAMGAAHVVLLLLDAQAGLTDQDMRLLGLVMEMGKGLVIVFNKWDDMDDYQRDQFKQAIERRLQFAEFARRYFISALHGTGVGKLYHAIDEAFQSANKKISTALLTRTLEKALREHQPPLVSGRRIKIRYAHVGGHHPLVIVLHGKQMKSLPGSYQRYLVNYFRKAFELVGVPIILQLRNDENPYV
ncbi:MAG: ribosome biogenesis GTPase Der [Gammaproteobacteria bacterium]|nr:ribosome biogenesis GTPase Der [Gammaproteobacteria bacterium]